MTERKTRVKLFYDLELQESVTHMPQFLIFKLHIVGFFISSGVKETWFLIACVKYWKIQCMKIKYNMKVVLIISMPLKFLRIYVYSVM